MRKTLIHRYLRYPETSKLNVLMHVRESYRQFTFCKFCFIFL